MLWAAGICTSFTERRNWMDDRIQTDGGQGGLGSRRVRACFGIDVRAL